MPVRRKLMHLTSAVTAVKSDARQPLGELLRSAASTQLRTRPAEVRGRGRLSRLPAGTGRQCRSPTVVLAEFLVIDRFGPTLE